MMFLLMGLLAGLAAVGLLIGAGWTYFKSQREMQSRVATTGVVVELVRRSTTRSHILCPMVEFTSPAGEKLRFTSDFGSLPAGYQVGQGVKVRYDPANPQNAEIESGMSLWLAPLIMVFMGVIACCLSTAFLVFYSFGISP